MTNHKISEDITEKFARAVDSALEDLPFKSWTKDQIYADFEQFGMQLGKEPEAAGFMVSALSRLVAEKQEVKG